MALIVQKYGGSSLATPKHIRRAAERIAQVKREGKEVVVVVSAMGKFTDRLVRLAHKTVNEPCDREMDMLLSAGERVSMSLLAMVLHEMGIPAISFTGSQSGIVTTSDHTNARIIAIRAHRIREELAKSKVVIIAGFQGVSESKEITTLGRGGSDTTAVALAAELGAECCEILTDVDGIFTADPRFVPGAERIEACTYDEALELANRGAKLQARSVEVAKRFSVPVRVSHSLDPQRTGTLISQATHTDLERSVIRGIATRDNLSFFRAKGNLKVIRKILKEVRITCRHFQVGDSECSWLTDTSSAGKLRSSLSKQEITFDEVSRACMVSLVGESIADAREVMEDLLEAVELSGAPLIAMASNSLSLCVVVDSAHKQDLATLLHTRFIEAPKNKKSASPCELAPFLQ